MAAALSACILDIDKDDIRKALSDFEGVEHRLELAANRRKLLCDPALPAVRIIKK